MSLTLLIISSCDPGLQSEEVYDIETQTIQLTDSSDRKSYPAWSPNGKFIAYVQEGRGILLSTVCACGGSQSTPLLKEDDYYFSLTLSPDGSKIAYRSLNTGRLTVRGLMDTAVTVLAPEISFAHDPIWSPDGSLIAFNAFLSEGTPIFLAPASGGAAVRLTLPDVYRYYCGSFSPDGERIVLYSERSGNYEIWTVNVRDGELMQLTFPPRNKRMPIFSPDGNAIAFVTYEDTCSTQKSTLWLMASDGSGARELMMLERQPDYLSWSPDGNTLAVETTSGIQTISVESGQVRGLLPSGKRPCWFPDSQTLLVSRGISNYSIYAVSLETREVAKISDVKVDTAFYPVWLNDEEVAFIRNINLWKIAISGRLSQRLTRDAQYYRRNLEISRDRANFCFDDSRDIYMETVNGDPPINLTAHISEPLQDPTWSPDGKQIACRYMGGIKLFALVSGKLVERRAITGSYGEPSWSPSARFGSYLALRSSGIVLFPLDSPDPEPRLAISNGSNASWSPDGTRLAYVKDDDIFVSRVFDDIR